MTIATYGLFPYLAIFLTAVAIYTKTTAALDHMFTTLWAVATDRSFFAYVAERHLAHPGSAADPSVPTLTGSARKDLQWLTGLRDEEVDMLIEGLETDSQQIALRALIDFAWPFFDAHGIVRARLELLAPIGESRATRLIHLALTKTGNPAS